MSECLSRLSRSGGSRWSFNAFGIGHVDVRDVLDRHCFAKSRLCVNLSNRFLLFHFLIILILITAIALFILLSLLYILLLVLGRGSLSSAEPEDGKHESEYQEGDADTRSDELCGGE